MWQPIATAPKDGTDILVFQPAFEKHGIKSWQVERMAVASWNRSWSVSHVGGWECETEIEWEAVTHWMPLPESPRLTAAKGHGL